MWWGEGAGGEAARIPARAAWDVEMEGSLLREATARSMLGFDFGNGSVSQEHSDHGNEVKWGLAGGCQCPGVA